MADFSRITGNQTFGLFSDYGGAGGAHSTASGVGGVGTYHYHHRSQTKNQTKKPLGPGRVPAPALKQGSDLMALLGSQGKPSAPPAGSPPAAPSSTAQGLSRAAVSALYAPRR